MVRKVSKAAALILLLVMAMTAQASAAESVYLIDRDTMTFYTYAEEEQATPYAVGDGNIYDGTISTTYLTIFKDVVAKLGINDDYVFYRSGQYEYALIAGDLNYNGNTIRLNESGTKYVLTYQSNYGQDNYYHWEVSDISSFSLTLGDYLIYSNLGGYPTLEERETIYEFATLFLLSALCIAFVVRSVFCFCGNRRR